MELDDLRRQWRQQPAEAEPAAVTEQQLAQLLQAPTHNPVRQLLSSISFEQISSWVGIGVGLVLIGAVDDLYSRAMGAWVLLMSLGGLRYFHHKKQLVRQLQTHHESLRTVLAQRLRVLRDMLQRYRRSTLWTLPITFGIGFSVQIYNVLTTYTGSLRWLMLGGITGGYVLIGLFTAWAMGKFVDWYLQQLYGRHLDRLEAALRELEA